MRPLVSFGKTQPGGVSENDTREATPASGRRVALLDRLAGLLPALDAGRHDEHVLVAELERRTGALVASHSMRVRAIEDQLARLVLGKIALLHGIELDPLRGGEVALRVHRLLVVVEDVHFLLRDQIRNLIDGQVRVALFLHRAGARRAREEQDGDSQQGGAQDVHPREPNEACQCVKRSSPCAGVGFRSRTCADNVSLVAPRRRASSSTNSSSARPTPRPRTPPITAIRSIFATPGGVKIRRAAPQGTPSSQASACTASPESCASSSSLGRTPCSSTKTIQRSRRHCSTSLRSCATRMSIMPSWAGGTVRWPPPRAPLPGRGRGAARP